MTKQEEIREGMIGIEQGTKEGKRELLERLVTPVTEKDIEHFIAEL